MNYSKGAILIANRNFPCNSGNLGLQGMSLVKDPLDYHMVRGIASLVDQERFRKIYLSYGIKIYAFTHFLTVNLTS